jgi:hypothetical protein
VKSLSLSLRLGKIKIAEEEFMKMASETMPTFGGNICLKVGASLLDLLL